MIFESDKDLSILFLRPLCSKCKRLKPTPENPRRCEAFETIPSEIWNGEWDHTEAYPGDHGLQYHPQTPVQDRSRLPGGFCR